MRNLTLSKKFPITSNDIADVEMRLDITFPNPYQEFLLINNGQKPIECNFIKDKDWILSINTLYSINSLNEDSLYEIAKMYYSNFMSKQFIPFGDDGDWIFVISIRHFDYGTIYMYKTDTGEDEDFLVYLSPSLEDFINQLVPNISIKV